MLKISLSVSETETEVSKGEASAGKHGIMHKSNKKYKGLKSMFINSVILSHGNLLSYKVVYRCLRNATSRINTAF